MQSPIPASSITATLVRGARISSRWSGSSAPQASISSLYRIKVRRLPMPHLCPAKSSASGLGAATPFLEAKQAIALAAFSSKRPSSQPALPTIAEAGFKDFNLRSWMGIFVRRGTAPDIEKKLEAEILTALDDADLKARLDRLGLDVSPMGRDQFPDFVRDEVKAWEDIVKATASRR